MMLISGLLDADMEVIFIGNHIDPELAGQVRFIRLPPPRGPSGFRNYFFHQEVQRALEQFPRAVSYSLSRTYPVDIYRVTDPLHLYHLYLNYRSPLRRLWARLSPRHRLILSLERELLKAEGGCRAIVAISKLDARLLKELYGIGEERIHVIYNGVDLELFRPGLTEDRATARRSLGIGAHETIYLFAGMDFRRKGLETAIRAMTNLRHPFRLLVAGSGRERGYRSLAASLGLSDRVVFLGRVPDMPPLYRAADMLVLPTTYDPFGNVHLEALACGLPVITTRQAGGAEVVNHGRTGYIMRDAGSAEELAGLLKEFEACRDQWPTWRRLARQSVEDFTLNRNIQRNLELISEAAERKAVA
jgi:UDP-glucose:(heptosyl)LPS alpha-1,3-glucosyltransferase